MADPLMAGMLLHPKVLLEGDHLENFQVFYKRSHPTPFREPKGLIGRSWAMVFASGGYRVKIYDIQAGQARRAQEDISKEMRKLQDSGFLRGLLSAEEQTSLISSHDDLKETLESAFFIQVNPPYYVKLVELVPHPETDSTVVDVTYNMMKEVGQSPVRLRREIDGFALNRIQYAVIAEAWRLVKCVGPLQDARVVSLHLNISCTSVVWRTAGDPAQLGHLEDGRTGRGTIPTPRHERAAIMVCIRATGSELRSSTLSGPG
ncbi:CRYL1 protein, partial [Polypterus senegalus]